MIKYKELSRYSIGDNDSLMDVLPSKFDTEYLGLEVLREDEERWLVLIKHCASTLTESPYCIYYRDHDIVNCIYLSILEIKDLSNNIEKLMRRVIVNPNDYQKFGDNS